MKQHQLPNGGKTDDWLTPPDILLRLGKFDFDPCPYPMPNFNGLEIPWIGRVWCNPPFNRQDRPKWMERIALHGNGILLIPAATETKAFYNWVWSKADAICFVEGRPHFHFPDGRRAPFNCGTAITLIAYGPINVRILKSSELGMTMDITPALARANESSA